MSIARIIWAASAVAAILLAFVTTGFNGTILALLGLVSGWFLDKEHRRGVIIAAAFLFAGGYGALGEIQGIGEHLTAILTALTSVFGAAAVMAIVRTLCERVLRSNTV